MGEFDSLLRLFVGGLSIYVVTFSMDLLLQLVLVDGLLLNASFKIAPSSALAKLMMCFFITGQITSMKYFFI